MTDAQEPYTNKSAVVRALLERGSVYMHLDPRVPGVEVPPAYHGDFHLILEIGYDMVIQIPDLDIGDDFLVATLSFARRPFRCRIPWGAVFAAIAVDGEHGAVWPADTPAELEHKDEVEGTKTSRGHLRLVK